MLQGAFQHRSGRVVAVARMLFACVSMIAIWADPTQPSRYPLSTYGVLWVYVILSAAYLVGTWNNWWLEQRLALAGHALDVCLFGAMVFLTAGYTSPFFTFFVYILLSATIRWGWRQTAFASAAVIALFVAAALLSSDWHAAPLEVSRIIMRATYLVVLSLLLIWFGYSLEAQHSGRLSGHGRDIESTQLSIRSGLEAAMARAGAREAALVWSEEEEPWVNLAVLRNRELTQHRYPPHNFGELVAEDLQGKTFIFDCRHGRALAKAEEGPLELTEPASPLDPELVTAIDVQEGLAVPVGSESHGGLLILSGIDGLCADDLRAGQLAGEEMSALLEQSAAIVATEEAAATRTRLALARDLHDSIVQLLAGTSMRLEGIKQAIASGKEVTSDLDTLQRDLSEQQRDLRLIIGQLRDVPAQGAPAKLKLILQDALDGAARHWGVRGTMGRCPEGNDVAVGLQGQLRHLLNESVANAVKHGKAASVKLSAELEDGALVMTLEDDGTGIRLSDQNGQNKPWSLYERVQELGGTLSLQSHGRGSQVRFTVPWSQAS